MKFGKTLKRIVNSDWQSEYVDYKALKSRIKHCTKNHQHNANNNNNNNNAQSNNQVHSPINESRLEFFQSLEFECLKVDKFYNSRLDEWQHEFEKLEAEFDSLAAATEKSKSADGKATTSTDESTLKQIQLKQQLTNLCNQCDKLRSYVLVNHLAFIKILKKYDKHVTLLQSETNSPQHQSTHPNQSNTPELSHNVLMADPHIPSDIHQIKSGNDSPQSANALCPPDNDSRPIKSDDSSPQLLKLFPLSVCLQTSITHIETSSMICMEYIMRQSFYSSPRLASLITNVQCLLQSIQLNDAQTDSSDSQQSTSTDDLSAITCPICLDVLSLPVVLSCSHTYCFACLTRWSVYSDRCAVCRLEHSLDPTDYQVNTTLETFIQRHYAQQQRESNADKQQQQLIDHAAAAAAGATSDESNLKLHKQSHDAVTSGKSTDEPMSDESDEQLQSSKAITATTDQTSLVDSSNTTRPSPIGDIDEWRRVQLHEKRLQAAHEAETEIASQTQVDSKQQPPSKTKQYDLLSTLNTCGINHLLKLQIILPYCVPHSFVILDIDETLITNAYSPCLLTSERGTQCYQQIMSRNALYSHLSLKQKNAVTRILQQGLDSRKLCESNASRLVRELQTQYKCKVFGLTKRYASGCNATRSELQQLGIDLALTSPFPIGRRYCDEATQALLADGIIYTNGYEKGPILDRFLGQIAFAKQLAELTSASSTSAAGGGAAGESMKKSASRSSLPPAAQSSTAASTEPNTPATPVTAGSSTTTSSAASSSSKSLSSTLSSLFTGRKSTGESSSSQSSSHTSSASSTRQTSHSAAPAPTTTVQSVADKPASQPHSIPPALLFVDDLYENALSVHQSMSVCRRLSIPVYTCHYTNVKDEIDELNDEYTKKYLDKSKMKQYCTHAQSSSSSSSSLNDDKKSESSKENEKTDSNTTTTTTSATSNLTKQLNESHLKNASADSSSSDPSEFNCVQCHSLVQHSDMEIVQYQVYHLVNKQVILNDVQAQEIITKLKRRQATSGGSAHPVDDDDEIMNDSNVVDDEALIQSKLDKIPSLSTNNAAPSSVKSKLKPSAVENQSTTTTTTKIQTSNSKQKINQNSIVQSASLKQNGISPPTQATSTSTNHKQ